MFRLGEVRAIAIKFERKDGTGLPGKGKPCWRRRSRLAGRA